MHDCRADLDWVAKELLIEVINMSNQIINEYCLGMDLAKDWIELQRIVFAQINAHLQCATNKTIAQKKIELDDITYDIANEPFNLETLYCLSSTGFLLELAADNLFGVSEGSISPPFIKKGRDMNNK